MDLVDKQDVARLEVGQHRGEIAGALNDRAGGRAEADRQFAGDDLRQGGLAEPGRTEEQHVIERLAAAARGVDEDAQIVAQLALTDELLERRRPDRGFRRILLGALGGDDSSCRVAHRAAPCVAGCPSSCSPARISASSAALSPSLRAAVATAPNASARR